MSDEREVALLMGGPFHMRTVRVQHFTPEVLIPLPDPRPLTLDPYEPVALDLKVARYERAERLSWRGEIVATLFEFDSRSY